MNWWTEHGRACPVDDNSAALAGRELDNEPTQDQDDRPLVIDAEYEEWLGMCKRREEEATRKVPHPNVWYVIVRLPAALPPYTVSGELFKTEEEAWANSPSTDMKPPLACVPCYLPTIKS